MRLSPADAQSFLAREPAAFGNLGPVPVARVSGAPRLSLPPLTEDYVARVAGQMEQPSPASERSRNPWPARVHRLDIRLGQVVGIFVVLSLLGVLV